MGNINHLKGNIIRATDSQRILIHSCNCEGSWGGGIAYQLAKCYPKAEQAYENICYKYGSKLLGKCFLIPSFEADNLLICCLFTSSFGGSSHDQQRSILENTRLALNHLRTLLIDTDSFKQDNIDKELNQLTKGVKPELANYKLEMPKINSGIFGVPWEKTEQMLIGYSAGDHPLHFDVYSI